MATADVQRIKKVDQIDRQSKSLGSARGSGFCSEEKHERLLRVCHSIEKYVIDSGIQLIRFRKQNLHREQKKQFSLREQRISEPGKLESYETEILPHWMRNEHPIRCSGSNINGLARKHRSFPAHIN
ncbi:MAG: hypothetical protein JO232_14780 [Verrucomicrobia bacterium]|nr:hypothetical protein [Verrucomicrobiota bacterium]